MPEIGSLSDGSPSLGGEPQIRSSAVWIARVMVSMMKLKQGKTAVGEVEIHLIKWILHLA
jgi:hypothetical protein